MQKFSTTFLNNDSNKSILDDFYVVLNNSTYMNLDLELTVYP